MVTKMLKKCLIGGVIVSLAGGFFFGKDMVSYLHSSAKSVRTAVKGSVPIEFELRRARDLLEDIIPEMHANIRLMAHEEVEVANLKVNIQQSAKTITDEKQCIAKLRQSLNIQHAAYTFSDQQYSRNQIKQELARRFERFKEAEVVLEGKKRLLAAREKSLQAAVQLLEGTRSKKLLLEDKIEGLTSQHRLIQASAVGSPIKVDNSKLARTEKLIAEIQKRLDVAKRVLAHESRFVQDIPVDAVVSETDLLTEIDEYFDPTGESEAVIAANNELPDLCQADSSL